MAGSANTSRDLRNARESEEFAWVTSHVFRKTAATELDGAGLTARQIADLLGHAKVSMTQDRHLGRRAVGNDAAKALERAHPRARGDRQKRVSGPMTSVYGVGRVSVIAGRLWSFAADRGR
jgi:integrase